MALVLHTQHLRVLATNLVQNHRLQDELKRMEQLIAQQREEIARLNAENSILRANAVRVPTTLYKPTWFL